jgi:hypothetical protein
MRFANRRPGIAGRWCPVDGCGIQKRPMDLLCREHWDHVPKSIQARVWKHWRARQRGDRAAIRLHYEACRDAIAAVTETPEQLWGPVVGAIVRRGVEVFHL